MSMVSRNQECKNAEGIEIVWNEFVSYIDKNIGRYQRECLVAWNGESGDMKWIYKLTQAPGSKLAMPKGIKYSSSYDQEAPNGISIPFLRNSFLRHAFEFMRLCIHFSNNLSRSAPGALLIK